MVSARPVRPLQICLVVLTVIVIGETGCLLAPGDWWDRLTFAGGLVLGCGLNFALLWLLPSGGEG